MRLQQAAGRFDQEHPSCIRTPDQAFLVAIDRAAHPEDNAAGQLPQPPQMYLAMTGPGGANAYGPMFVADMDVTDVVHPKAY